MQPSRSGPFDYIPITQRPRQKLPGNARVALWVIPNVEVFALNEPIPGGRPKVPDVRTFSTRDYGARIGVYRVAEVLKGFGIRATVALNSDVCDQYPQLVEHMIEWDWEMMGHNKTNSRLLNEVPPDTERDVIFATMDRIEKAFGKRPRGWLGSGMAETWNTLEYLQEAGIEYCCDWVNDDQPYLMKVGKKPMVSIPYAGEINDLPIIANSKHSAKEFEEMIKAAFDVLYREGADSARTMAIALHPFVIGQPHRIGALESALDYILRHDGVWVATGSEIVANFLAGEAF